MLTKNNYYLRMPSAFSSQTSQVQFYKKSHSVDQIMFESVTDEANQKKFLNKDELYTFNQMLWVIANCIDLKQHNHRKLLYQWLEDYHIYFSQLEIFEEFIKKIPQEIKAQTTNQINASLGLEKKESTKVDNDKVAQNQDLARIKATDKLIELLSLHAYEVAEQCPQLLKLLKPHQLDMLSNPFNVGKAAFANKESFTYQLDRKGIKILERTPSKFLVLQTMSHWQKKPDWKMSSNSKLQQLKKTSDPHFKKLNEALFKDYLPNFTKLPDEEKNKLAEIIEDSSLDKILQWPVAQQFSQLRKDVNYKELKNPNDQDAAVRILKKCAHSFVKNKIAQTTLGWGEMASIVFSKRIFNLTQEVEQAKRKKCITELAGCYLEEFDESQHTPHHWQDQAILDEIIKHWDDIQTENYGRQHVLIGGVHINVFFSKLLQSPHYEDRLIQSCNILFGDISPELWEKLTIKKVFQLAVKSCIPQVKAHFTVQLIRKINETGGVKIEEWNNEELRQLLSLPNHDDIKGKFIFALRKALEKNDALFFEKILTCFNDTKNQELQKLILDILFIKPGNPSQLSIEERQLISEVRDKFINFKPDSKLKEIHDALKQLLGQGYLVLAENAGDHMVYFTQVARAYDGSISFGDPEVLKKLSRPFIADMKFSPNESPIDHSTPTMLIRPIIPSTMEVKQTTPSYSTPEISNVKLPKTVVAVPKKKDGPTPEAIFHTGRSPFSPISTNGKSPSSVFAKSPACQTPGANNHAVRAPFSPNPHKKPGLTA